MPKSCKECGHRPESSVRFCPECGASIKRKKQETSTTSEKPKEKIDIPNAATGDEAGAIYKRMIATVKSVHPNDQEKLSAFKQDCKQYGQGELKAKTFYHHLENYFGSRSMLAAMLPQLVRLIPDERKRKKLLKAHRKYSSQQDNASIASNATTFDSQQDVLDAKPSSRMSMNRYADSPNCSICGAEFEMKNRRHTCRKCGSSVCNTCSPIRMLVPPDQLAISTKDYAPGHPQRVCTLCAPALEPYQTSLNSEFANCHKDNPHQARARFHMPYSSTLEKECRTAADILSNFFGHEYGADSDRQIPVSFLRKAQGLVFLTVVKAGFLVTAKVGTGIVIGKLDDGTWSAPSAIGTAGLGGGFEAGGEIVEFMIILGSQGALQVFHRTQVNVGGGLSVAVGPYGRDASAQAGAGKGGFNANLSYSHSRGLYLGISLSGAIIKCRQDTNAKFYGQQLTPKDILTGQVPRPNAAKCLYDAIDNAMEGVAAFDQQIQMKKQAAWEVHCICCGCQHYVSKAFSKKCGRCNHIHGDPRTSMSSGSS